MSSGTLRELSLVASSARVRARPVSWSSRILRATDSGSASGPASRSLLGSLVGQRDLEVDAIRVNPGSVGLEAAGVGLGGGVDGRRDAELLEDALLDLVG